MNENLELSKVRILSNHLQSEANSKKSLVFTAFVSMLIFIATLSIQMMQTNHASFTFVFIVMFVFADLAFVVYMYFLLKKEEIKNLGYINELLEKIENGKALPSLNELEKRKYSKEDKIMTSNESMDDPILRSHRASFFAGALLSSLLGILGNLFVSLLFEDWINNKFYLLALIASIVFSILISVLFWILAKRYAMEDAKRNRH